MITLSNIVKNYAGHQAVKGVTITVAAGEIFGLVGPDGAGKTSIIRMLTGVLQPTAGSLTVLGSSNPEAIKGDIGYIPQKFSLYGELTVMENIALMGSLYGKSKAEIEQAASEILTFTNLFAFKDRLADNLSGGMKQKLALAAGLMHKPKILFLDEPTTGVDPVSRREFWQMLYRLNKDGMTVFVSTPYMDEAELCTRVAFMHDGQITRCDSPQELRQSYPYKILELITSARNVKRVLDGLDVIDINAFGNSYHLVVKDAARGVELVSQALSQAGVEFSALTEAAPSLEDVFVALTREVA